MLLSWHVLTDRARVANYLMDVHVPVRLAGEVDDLSLTDRSHLSLTDRSHLLPYHWSLIWLLGTLPALVIGGNLPISS